MYGIVDVEYLWFKQQPSRGTIIFYSFLCFHFNTFQGKIIPFRIIIFTKYCDLLPKKPYTRISWNDVIFVIACGPRMHLCIEPYIITVIFMGIKWCVLWNFTDFTLNCIAGSKILHPSHTIRLTLNFSSAGATKKACCPIFPVSLW